MENPLSWTPVHWTIEDAIMSYQFVTDDSGAVRPRDPELIGGSMVAAIYEALLKDGHLKDESRTPAYTTWDELREGRRS